MGRGRGKGKKLPLVTSHEDPGSGGEEPLPAYKRRGRPQKPLKDDIDEDVAEKIEEEGGDGTKASSVPVKEMKAAAVENGKRRKRNLLVKESSNLELDLEEKGKVVSANTEVSTRSNGYRQNGNRRKSKPHRAAEAGVIC
ncbi:uncharacterized protein M6B38_187170 [Iris pallida]|uniref:Uncharacterized protein n=1 Tax=Iris pallida TaxID=29817 RepID=A0AAX6EJ70_IRIPA|nr:uncharacterized protein M6B38_186405 [Iris pallida]KAJ6804251.1 uncharacterized protein M6B38_187170 [Iris pallida]